MRLLASALLVCVVLTTAACGSGSSAPRADRSSGAPSGYAAVPDDQLFSAVRDLPGVESVDLRHVDQLGESNTYRGEVRCRGGLSKAEVAETFDHVVEILRHGRWGATTTVTVTSGAVVEQGGSRDLYSASDFERRYGPQTGEEGWPPSFLPAGGG